MNSTEDRNRDGAGDGRGLDPYKLHDDVLRVMSDTPRTDAAALGFARLLIDHEKSTTTELVDANFARQLERENWKLIEEGAERIADIEAYKRQLVTMQRIIERHEAREAALDVCAERKP